MALSIARPGSIVGYVGMPHGVEISVQDIFYRNVGLRGGPTPARAYMPGLLDDILLGHINPGRIFDFTTDLNGIEEAYAAMDERRAVKSLVKLQAGEDEKASCYSKALAQKIRTAEDSTRRKNRQRRDECLELRGRVGFGGRRRG